jgi:hypothetical protein
MRLRNIAAMRSVVGVASAALLAFPVLALPVGAMAQTSERVLSEASARDGDDCAVVGILLNAPVRLLSALPPSNASELQIRIAPVAGAEQIATAGVWESIRAPTSNNVTVQRIEFDGDNPSGPTLTITFDRSMNYVLTQGGDFRSLSLSVSAKTPNPVCKPEAVQPDRGRPSAGPPREIGLPPTTAESLALDNELSADDRSLLVEARASLTAGDAGHAVVVLTRLLEHLAGPTSAAAQELLGVARERNGDLSLARNAYQAYLELVPQGPNADRVRQRLATLIYKTTPQNVDVFARPTKPGQKPRDPKAGVWSVNGSIATYYMLDKSEQTFKDASSGITTRQTDTNLNQILTSADFTATYQNSSVKVKFRATGSYADDLRTTTPTFFQLNSIYNRPSTLSNLYIEASTPGNGLYGRIGRQTLTTGGVLGRFDGATVSVKLTDMLKLQVTAGAPVDSSRLVSFNTDKYFYSVAVPIGRIAKAWDFDIYAVEQHAYGMLDRRAIGGEARFMQPGRSAYAVVDYDVYFNQLNYAIFNTSIGFLKGGLFNFGVDYRHSPLLFSNDAVIGQQVTNLSQLRSFYTEAEIKQLALARTTYSSTVNLGVSYPVTPKTSINSDLSITKMGGMPASGNVPASEPTQVEFYYSLQLVNQSVLKQGDTGIIGLRYANTTNSDRYFMDFSARYPITKDFRINPSVSFGYRTNKLTTGDEVSVQSLLRATYVGFARIQLEPEIGVDWLNDKSPSQTNTTLGYHGYLGIRKDF